MRAQGDAVVSASLSSWMGGPATAFTQCHMANVSVCAATAPGGAVAVAVYNPCVRRAPATPSPRVLLSWWFGCRVRRIARAANSATGPTAGIVVRLPVPAAGCVWLPTQGGTGVSLLSRDADTPFWTAPGTLSRPRCMCLLHAWPPAAAAGARGSV